ncbi:MAG: hypothetical protein Q4D13_02640 [Erysipelotrichaceae bacterium]|nr:hypothetical protein [Erysipelotrichaceae bacterium]
MKKLLVLLMVLMMLSGCSNSADSTPAAIDSEPDISHLTIVTPLGAPVLAFYDQIENENYSRVAANAIPALWTGEESPDILVCDLTSGVQAIRNGADYKIGAIVTFGNLYIASTGKDDDGVISKGDKIVLFGNENAIPSKVWHYLYNDEFDEELFYENSASEAAAALASGKNSAGDEVDYVFLAQPAMFASLNKAKENGMEADIYLDVQKEYYERSGYEFVQAALFVKNTVTEDEIKIFLLEREIIINAGIEDPTIISESLGVYKGDEAVTQYGFNPDVMINVLKMENGLGNNAAGLGFKKAITIKDEIDAMLQLFNIEKTDETMYNQ